MKSLNESLDRLVKEKEQIGSLLRSALSKRSRLDETNELFKAAENGLKEVGIDFKFSEILGDHKVPASQDRDGSLDMEGDEIYTLVTALYYLFA